MLYPILLHFSWNYFRLGSPGQCTRGRYRTSPMGGPPVIDWCLRIGILSGVPPSQGGRPSQRLPLDPRLCTMFHRYLLYFLLHASGCRTVTVSDFGRIIFTMSLSLPVPYVSLFLVFPLSPHSVCPHSSPLFSPASASCHFCRSSACLSD